MTEILPNRDWLAELASLDEAADFLKLAKQAPIELQSQIIALAGESFEGGEALAKALFKNPPPKVKQKPIQVIQQPAEVEIPRRTLADLTKAKPIPPTPKPLKLRQWSEVKVPDGVTELERLTYVPGLVGDITDWIVSGARRPNRLMAFGVALAIGGTLISRRIMGPTESATHLYVIIIGRSGRGKDWPLQCGERLMTELDLGDLVGPGEWASSPGLWLRLKRNPVLICFVDELGDELALVNGQNGNPFVSKIIGTLKKCYNAFSIQHTAEKVSAESDKIVWPAPSIVGAATVQKFFSSLTPSDLESGFANRLYVIPSDVRTSGEC